MIADTRPQMLHLLLSRATPNDRGPVFTATCGHRCVATPIIRERLQDESFRHVTYCIVCFNEETN